MLRRQPGPGAPRPGSRGRAGRAPGVGGAHARGRLPGRAGAARACGRAGALACLVRVNMGQGDGCASAVRWSAALARMWMRGAHHVRRYTHARTQTHTHTHTHMRRPGPGRARCCRLACPCTRTPCPPPCSRQKHSSSWRGARGGGRAAGAGRPRGAVASSSSRMWIWRRTGRAAATRAARRCNVRGACAGRGLRPAAGGARRARTLACTLGCARMRGRMQHVHTQHMHT